MEKQIEQAMKKAFFDKLDQDVSQNNLEHLGILLEEIREILKSMVPSKHKIHEKIDEELGHVSWDVQAKLVDWIEKFQAPEHDTITKQWREKIPTDTSVFLKWYYSHIQEVHKQVYEYRKKLANGEQIFKSDKVEGSQGVPSVMKSGKF